MKTLILTPWMTPHRVVSWQTAVTLLFLDKIEVLEEYDEVIRSPSLEIKTPAVVRLLTMRSMFRRNVRFSRINVFVRDGFRCQYCGQQRSMRELSYDHVLPRTQGGKTVWENIVTSCHPCNAHKRDRTPEQAGMKLLRPPFRPKSLPWAFIHSDLRKIPPLWTDYCQPRFTIEREPGGAIMIFQ